MNYALIVVKLTSVRWKVVVDIQGIDLTNSIFIKLDWITLQFTRHYTVEPLNKGFWFCVNNSAPCGGAVFILEVKSYTTRLETA